jgi:chemosensory pili system protein ChpA (sensor histidine kinase/response regulator)
MSTTDISATLAAYNVTDAAIAQMREQFLPLVIQSPEDKAGAKRVREARLIVKNQRVAVEKTRKTLKEDALRYGQAVDAEARRITAALLPIEEHLETQEAAIAAEVARREQEVANAKREKLRLRMEALAANGSKLLPLDVEALTDDQFADELARSAAEWHAAQERERQAAAERERVEAEQAEARRVEAERLAAQRAEQERVAAEQAAERERLAAEQRKLDEERAAVARAEELRLAGERAAQAERDRLARVEADRVERLRQEALEQQRRDAARPVAEKLLAYATAVEAVEVPAVPQSADVSKVIRAATAKIRALAATLVQ